MFRLLYNLISYVHKLSPKSFQYELAHAIVTNKNAAARFHRRADTSAFRNRLCSGRVLWVLVINMYVFETSIDTQLGAVRRPVGVFPDLTGRSPPEARTIEHGLQKVSRAG